MKQWTLHTKRIYAPPDRADGLRILVDRLWPRGLTRLDAHTDFWLKDLAPDTALRRWFGHDPARWEEFRRRYSDQLDQRPEAVQTLRELLASHPVVTLLYAARDEQYNHANALSHYLFAHLN